MAAVRGAGRRAIFGGDGGRPRAVCIAPRPRRPRRRALGPTRVPKRVIVHQQRRQAVLGVKGQRAEHCIHVRRERCLAAPRQCPRGRGAVEVVVEASS